MPMYLFTPTQDFLKRFILFADLGKGVAVGVHNPLPEDETFCHVFLFIPYQSIIALYGDGCGSCHCKTETMLGLTCKDTGDYIHF